jgi:hypothetical protein
VHAKRRHGHPRIVVGTPVDELQGCAQNWTSKGTPRLTTTSSSTTPAEVTVIIGVITCGRDTVHTSRTLGLWSK